MGPASQPAQTHAAHKIQGNVKAYPISPVAGVVAVRLAIEVVHISRRPAACAREALAKV